MNNKVDDLARLLARDMVEQNHMLELLDDAEDSQLAGIGVYDEYDNKFYDMRRLARIALRQLASA